MELSTRSIDEEIKPSDEIRELEIQLQRIYDNIGPEQLEIIRNRAANGDREAEEYIAWINALTKSISELRTTAAYEIEVATADMDFSR